MLDVISHILQIMLLVDVVISINGGPGMKPLEEYMLFTKQASETVRATIPAGVRSAQCAVFHAQPGGLEPPRNDSVVRDSQLNNIKLMLLLYVINFLHIILYYLLL